MWLIFLSHVTFLLDCADWGYFCNFYKQTFKILCFGEQYLLLINQAITTTSLFNTLFYTYNRGYEHIHQIHFKNITACYKWKKPSTCQTHLIPQILHPCNFSNSWLVWMGHQVFCQILSLTLTYFLRLLFSSSPDLTFF